MERHATVEMIPATQSSVGLAPAREHRPDVIILHLRDIDGEVVLARLKADSAIGDIRVIVLTADASKGLDRSLARLRSCEFLSKRLDVPRLLKVVAAHIDRAGLLLAPTTITPASR